MSSLTPLQSFLQNMLSEKSDHSTGTAEITIVVDNASPARYRRRMSTSSISISLDVSDHSRGKSRWDAEHADQGDFCSQAPVQAPPRTISPRVSLAKKTPVIECDSDDDDDDDGLIL